MESLHTNSQIQALIDIGFNNLEAEIYLTLLQEPQLTGYGIAKILGKPVANTYKALEALKNKGAVLLEETSNSKIYTATDINSYLNLMEEQFNNKRKNAESQLQNIGKIPSEEGIYKLQTIEQVYERCRNMFDNAKKAILADIFPIPLENLKENFEKVSRKKNVEVHIKVYQQITMENCHLIESFNAKELLELWQKQWVIISTDIKESLIAVISDDGETLHYGIWTRNPYINFIIYNGALNEMISFTMQNLLKKNKDPDYIFDYIQVYQNVTQLAKHFNSIVPHTNN